MTIQELAEQYRLKTSRDECGEVVVRGKLGIISEHDAGMFAAVFMPDEHNERPQKSWGRLWGAVREKCLTAGMTLRQEGDVEGVFLFDPANKAQAKLAIKVTRVKVRKQLSPERAAELATRLAAMRARHGNARVEVAQ